MRFVFYFGWLRLALTNLMLKILSVSDVFSPNSTWSRRALGLLSCEELMFFLQLQITSLIQGE